MRYSYSNFPEEAFGLITTFKHLEFVILLVNVLQSCCNFIISTGYWDSNEHTQQKGTYKDACHVCQR